MRSLLVLSLGVALASSLAASAQSYDPHRTPAASLEVEDAQPGDAAPSPNGPVLEKITWRHNVLVPAGFIFDVVPDFHFRAPNGNAVVLRRELVSTTGAIGQTQIRNATINIPAEAQKAGAVLSGGWRCGAPVYRLTLRVFILDADGNRSNALRYTIHCNGG